MSYAHTSDEKTGLPKGGRSWLRNNIQRIDDIGGLPEPGTEWRKAGMNLPSDMVRKLHDYGVIEPTGKVNTRSNVRVWETTEIGYSIVQEELDTLNSDDGFCPCPCGHRGVENLGETYSCGRESCDREYTRDEMDI